MRRAPFQVLAPSFSLLFPFISVMILLPQLSSQGSGNLPPRWWEMCKARPIQDTQDYNQLMQGELKNKFVFVDFYMDYCPWCYYTLNDFNRLIDDMYEWYGRDRVAFIKIDGPKNKKLNSMFEVKSYPHFAAVLPNSGGKPYSTFTYQPRGYDTLKKWMIEVIGEEPNEQSETIQPVYQQTTQLAQSSLQKAPPQIIQKQLYQESAVADNSNEIQVLREQLSQVLTSNAQTLNNQSMLMTQAINRLNDQTIQQSQKIDQLLSFLTGIMNEEEKPVEPDPTSLQISQPTIFLIGIVIGIISAVLLVAFLNKQNQANKLKKRKFKKGPSSGSPLTHNLDEEKSA